ADALHERLLLDVAGNVAWLRERGFRRVILLGNSGGGSLFAFYLAQAGKPPAERLARAPSGDRVPLGEVEMPMADGLVLRGAPRRGRLPPGPPRSVGDRRGEPHRREPAPRHVRSPERLPPDGGGPVALRARLPGRVPRRAARALRAHRPPGARLVRGGGILPRQARERRRQDGACRARARDPPGAPAPLPPRLPDARRPALPGPEPRAVAAPARLDLLLRPRPDRWQLRRGARARHERARVAVDLVGP